MIGATQGTKPNAAVEISDGTSKKDQEWKDAHPFKCPCWKCMHVTKPWIEALDQAQWSIKGLEDEIKSLTAAYERKAGKQLGQ